METGLILALLAAVSFAVMAVVVRRATAQAGESFTATEISVFIGVPFFAVIITGIGDWDKLSAISWQAGALLAAAGIIHFVIGRLLGYEAYRLIGANKATTLTLTTPLYAVILGILILGETLTVFLVLGVVGIIFGAILITMERTSVSEKMQSGKKSELKGILLALGGALCWGISPVLIKPAVRELGSPFAASFVSYVAAAAVMAFFLCRRRHRESIIRFSIPSAMVLMVIGGLFAAAGHLFNYTALSVSPASLVTPIIGTSVLFTFILSFLINRQIEVFTFKVILGMLVMVAGILLISR